MFINNFHLYQGKGYKMTLNVGGKVKRGIYLNISSNYLWLTGILMVVFFFAILVSQIS
jgi:hypothetical protein